MPVLGTYVFDIDRIRTVQNANIDRCSTVQIAKVFLNDDLDSSGHGVDSVNISVLVVLDNVL